MQSQPLAARLKKRAHREIAFAQDLLVEEAYHSFPDCVLHGGTAIWRCYGGTRFSDDVDAYLPSFSTPAGVRFRDGLAAKGVKELKFKATGGTVFAKFDFGGAVVSFEGALRRAPFRVLMPYETLAGAHLIVATLPPEGLVKEKALAYLARRKVRDLYDLFFLLTRVNRETETIRAVKKLLEGYRRPLDEAQLKAMILAGVIPSADEMIRGIRRWAEKST